MASSLVQVPDYHNFWVWLNTSQQQLAIINELSPEGPFTINDFNPKKVRSFLEQHTTELITKTIANLFRKIETLHLRQTISVTGWKKFNDHSDALTLKIHKQMDRFSVLFMMGVANTSQLPTALLPTLKLTLQDTYRRPISLSDREKYQELINTSNKELNEINEDRRKADLVLNLTQSICEMINNIGELEDQLGFLFFCKKKGLLLNGDLCMQFPVTSEAAYELKVKIEILKEQYLAVINPPPKKKKKKKKKAKPEDAPSAAAPSAAPTIATPVATVDNQATERAARVIRLNQFQNQDGCREDDRAKRWHIPKSQIHRVEGFRDTDRNGHECLKYRYPHAKKTPELLAEHHQFLIQQLRNHDFKIHLVFNEPKEFIETYFYPRDWTNAKGVKQPGWVAFARQRTREGVVKGVLEVAIDKNNKLYHRVFVPMDKLDFRLLSLPLQKQLLADEEVKENGGPQQELEHEGHHAVDITPDDETLILMRGQFSDDDWVIHEIPKRKAI